MGTFVPRLGRIFNTVVPPMKLNDSLKLYEDKFMMADPVGYNDAVIRYFQEKYAKSIHLIFVGLQKKRGSASSLMLETALSSVPNTKLERHLLPIFAAASSTGGVHKHHLLFGRAFIKAVSLPLLRIDERLDFVSQKLKSAIQMSFKNKDTLVDLYLFNDGIADMCELPKASDIIGLVTSNYARLYTSLYCEMKLRYEEKSLSRPQKILQWILESQFSPLTCLYFSTTVQASFIINSKPVDQNVKQLSACFGRLRQLCDQISDVQEDIIMGNATVPVLYALAEGDQHLGQMIKALWRDIRETESNTDKLLISQKAAEIKELTQELGGLRQAYELADTWYQKAIGLTSECSQTLGVNTELALLIRLKRAYLERLRLNNWSDIPGYY